MVSKSVNSTKKILTHTNVFGLQNIKNKKVKKIILEALVFPIYTIVINTEQHRGVRFFNLINFIKTISMATSQQIFEEIKELFSQFEENHNATTKAGKSRARKAIGEIKKLVTDYRKASVEENK